jgi:ribonuclease P protein subunit RPR2
MRKDRAKEKKKAKVQMLLIMEEAGSIFDRNKKLCNDYVRKARRLAMKFNLRFPKEVKRKFCKHCYSYIKPGKNCTVRTKEGKVIYSCKECGKFMKFVIH